MTRDPRTPEGLQYLQAVLEHTQAVAQQRVGLNLHEANELTTRSGCHLRVIKRDGKGLTVTAELDMKRTNIETEGGIVVGSSPG